MTEREATELRALINVETQHIQVRVQCIGNGEYVVIIGGFFWLWSEREWTANKDYLLSLKTNPVGVYLLPKFRGVRV